MTDLPADALAKTKASRVTYTTELISHEHPV